MNSTLKLKLMMRIKYLWHFILYLIFRFEKWHLSSIESRDYSVDLVNFINRDISNEARVVEIGCGLGEIISCINCQHRYGYDVSKNVINAARKRSIFNKVIFNIGSFNSFSNLEIDYLIAVNFLHDFDKKQLNEWFHQVTNNNNINKIIVDEVSDAGYAYNHHFESLLKNSYPKITVINCGYKYGRSLKAFSKT